jgi:large subunit ribosomal protein L22
MEVKAQLNGLRIAPRKVRLVANLLKKKNVDAALDQLAHMNKRSALHVSRLINSAIANAEHNHKMVRSNLYIKSMWVDEGMKLKRWQPKGFGRAAPIQKKTSRVNVVLDERVAGMRAQVNEPKAKPETEQATERASAERSTSAAPKASKPDASGGKTAKSAKQKSSKGLAGLGRRLFRRKSI